MVTQPEKSRLQHFDRLLLFEDGCIVEMGPPAEVMASWHLKFGTHVLFVPIIIEYSIIHNQMHMVWKCLELFERPCDAVDGHGLPRCSKCISKYFNVLFQRISTYFGTSE